MNGSKHRSTDGLYESRKDGSDYSSTKREWNLQTHAFHDDSSNHRKYIRTRSSSKTRTTPLSSQQQRQHGDREKKISKDTKKPLRVSGDWSEFKSSSGKIYFYNCKTEVSQWEKPKGWSANEISSSLIRSSSISIDRTKKDSTNSSHASTIRSRHQMENTSTIKYHQNGDISSRKIKESFQSPELPKSRLPTPDDDCSRMSFSSTSSQESAAVTNDDRSSNLTDTVLYPSLQSQETTSIVSNDQSAGGLNIDEVRSSTTRKILPTPTTTTAQTVETEVSTPSISKAERDQEIQRYYRADLIQHLTNWPSTQLEKQYLKRFDDYYGYSAKMSTSFVDLKGLKSNFRILEIKRSCLTQRLLRCQQREDDKQLL